MHGREDDVRRGSTRKRKRHDNYIRKTKDSETPLFIIRRKWIRKKGGLFRNVKRGSNERQFVWACVVGGMCGEW